MNVEIYLSAFNQAVLIMWRSRPLQGSKQGTLTSLVQGTWNSTPMSVVSMDMGHGSKPWLPCIFGDELQWTSTDKSSCFPIRQVSAMHFWPRTISSVWMDLPSGSGNGYAFHVYSSLQQVRAALRTSKGCLARLLGHLASLCEHMAIWCMLNNHEWYWIIEW